MKTPVTKLCALALAGAMSFSTFTAVPATALATNFYPTARATAVRSYYDYGDWRINQLQRLSNDLGQLDYSSSNLSNDRNVINNAIREIQSIQSDYDWTRWVSNAYDYTYTAPRVTTTDWGYYTYDYNPYGYGYAAYAPGYGYAYGSGYAYGYNNGYDVYYNAYINAVDVAITSCFARLSLDAQTYWNDYINVDYWGYTDWNDYWGYWRDRGSRYYEDRYYEAAPASTPVYRLVNVTTGEHAYTSSSAVRDQFVSLGWTAEGTGWTAPASEGTAVYQLTKGNKYFYTKDANERDALVASGYSNDGVAFYSYTGTNARPVYRLYNGGRHFFTASTSERDSLVGSGWTNEGVAFYAM